MRITVQIKLQFQRKIYRIWLQVPQSALPLIHSCILLDIHVRMHYATNRQVAGSIPDGVIGIFQCHNPSGRTMDLGSTQPLTEMSTRCISWG
jgi:hypothetical protein